MITATPRRRRPVRIGLVQLSVRFRTSVRIELKRSGNLQTETPTKHATRHVRAMIEWGFRTGSVALDALMVCPGKSPLNGLSSRDRRLVVFDLSRSELRRVAQQFFLHCISQLVTLRSPPSPAAANWPKQFAMPVCTTSRRDLVPWRLSAAFRLALRAGFVQRFRPPVSTKSPCPARGRRLLRCSIALAFLGLIKSSNVVGWSTLTFGPLFDRA